jgi:hypothetical protein
VPTTALRATPSDRTSRSSSRTCRRPPGVGRLRPGSCRGEPLSAARDTGIERGSALGLAALVAALAVAGWAQIAFRTGRYEPALVASAAAVVFAGVAAWLGRAAAPRLEIAAEAPVSLRPIRPAALALAGGALLVALGLAATDRVHGLQIAAWGVACVTLNAAWWPRGLRPLANVGWGEIALVAGLLGCAWIARLYDLEHIPYGLYGDEGEFGLVGIPLLEGGRLPPFATAWDHHPTLFAWLQAGGMALAGIDVGGVRLASALAGGLMVVPLYVLLRAGFGFWAAVAGCAFLVASPWQVHFTRLASNNAYVALFTTAAMAALYLGVRRPRVQTWAALGTFLGLGFYFGNKAIGIPAMLLGGWIALAVTSGPEVRRQWRLWLLALVVALLVMAPQLLYWATHAEWYEAVAKHPDMNMLDAASLEGSRGALALDQLERSVFAFHFFHDESAFRVLVDVPLLARAEAALHWVGLAACLVLVRRPLPALLTTWFWLGLCGILLAKKPPQANHLIGMGAVPAALAGATVHLLWVHLGSVRPMRNVRAWIAALVIAGVTAQSAHEYFVGWAKGWSIAEITEIGRAMTEYAPTHRLVLMTHRMMWKQNSTLRFAARGIEAEDKVIQARPEYRWFEPGARDVAFIFDARRTDLLRAVRARYPAGEVIEHRDDRGKLRAVVIELPAEQVREHEFPVAPSPELSPLPPHRVQRRR